MKKERPIYNARTWEELPCVVLAKKIKQEKWAVNTVIRLSDDKANWESDTALTHHYTNPQIALTIPYATENISIYVQWESTTRGGAPANRFKIETPYDKIHKECRPKTSKTFHGAISRIEDIITQQIPSIDEEIARKKEQEEWERELEAQRKELKSQLDGVKLTNIYEDAVIYRASASYGLQITVDSKNPSLYTVRNIGGVFTIDEVRQIIKIVGTNPRAIAERLLK